MFLLVYENFIFRRIAEYREHVGNGRIPEVSVLERYQKRVREIINGRCERQLLLKWIPVRRICLVWLPA
ncbi:hypothetical protein A6M21_03855 [Desulfotomaculum copahuensis]|uniref:Uncharacterized protein n=1 Tax=Desulfotomaculum copahuensis TaxID=1838280 RepID=A0A1B7LIC7_9FIRM|nr:hypothetical protein A6M21_03855 [Desulfotomaculum copahuensis]